MLTVTHVSYTRADGWHLVGELNGEGWCIPTDRATVFRLWNEEGIPMHPEHDPFPGADNIR